MNDSILLDTVLTCKDTIIAQTENPSLLLKNEIWGMPENFARIFIPAIISIAVFVIGQVIVWYRNQKAIQSETRNYRIVILNWIDLIKSSVEKQITSCRTLSQAIANSQDIHPERFEYTKMLAEKVDSIGVDRFITTFMINSTSPKKNEDNNKMTYNLISQFSFLKAIEPNIAETYKSYQNQTLELMAEWNNYFMKLDQLTSDWTSKINSTHPYGPFHAKVVDISNKWLQNAPNGRSTMIYSMNHLITPLTSLVSEEIKKNANNEYAFQMSAVLQQLRIIDLKWRTNIDGNSKLFADLGTSIENAYNSLCTAKQYFKDKTTEKNIFSIRK